VRFKTENIFFQHYVAFYNPIAEAESTTIVGLASGATRTTISKSASTMGHPGSGL
jgi:hypothetical protein